MRCRYEHVDQNGSNERVDPNSSYEHKRVSVWVTSKSWMPYRNAVPFFPGDYVAVFSDRPLLDNGFLDVIINGIIQGETGFLYRSDFKGLPFFGHLAFVKDLPVIKDIPVVVPVPCGVGVWPS